MVVPQDYSTVYRKPGTQLCGALSRACALDTLEACKYATEQSSKTDVRELGLMMLVRSQPALLPPCQWKRYIIPRTQNKVSSNFLGYSRNPGPPTAIRSVSHAHELRQWFMSLLSNQVRALHISIKWSRLATCDARSILCCAPQHSFYSGHTRKDN